MGSHPSTQRKPTAAGAPKRKATLKNTTQRISDANERPYNMGNEPFETEVYRPDTQPIREPVTSEHERTYPATLPRQPEARTVPRVHYEDSEDVPTRRDGMVGERYDPVRPSGRRHDWMNDRPLPPDDRFTDIGGSYRRPPYGSQVVYEQRYHRHMATMRPYNPQISNFYPSRDLPPQIYPIRSRRPRYLPPRNNEIYRSPVPVVDERYRPVPIYSNSLDDIPRAVKLDQPPPYQALESVTNRRYPEEQPISYSIPPANDSIPPQNDDVDGGLTDRSRTQEEDDIAQSDLGRERIVQSLLGSTTQQVTDHRPASEESVHEIDDDEYIGANLRFYRNQIKFRPHGEKIDYIHRYWFGNYTLLEKTHTYMQWLFPLYESSKVNPDAVPLRAHEAKHISEDEETRHRFVTSYLMMLDFYGFCMTDEETGKIEKAANWKNRFENLRRSSYNQTRITRILKSLGELGQSKLQTPFVIALLHEVFETKELSGIPPATIHHWLRALSDDFERDYVFNQFKNGINRLDDERIKLKRQDNKKYYFERKKPVMQKDEHFQFPTSKKSKI